MNQIEALEFKIAKFLRVGVILAGLLMLIGWVSHMKFSGSPFYVFDTYDQIPFEELFMHHLRWKNWGMLTSYAGLVALISLPLIRVLLTAVIFIKRKEYYLSVIAFIVLLGLFISMTLGIEH